MKRSEAIVLLKELGSKHLLQPSFVVIDERKPGRFQLCIKGDYCRDEIEVFIKKYNLEIEENLAKGLICIFKP